MGKTDVHQDGLIEFGDEYFDQLISGMECSLVHFGARGRPLRTPEVDESFDIARRVPAGLGQERVGCGETLRAQ